MNNFLGLGLIIYLSIFIYKSSADVPDEYSVLKKWVAFQVIFMYICLGICLAMVLCFRSMQHKVVRKKEEEENAKIADKDKAE